MERQRFTDEEMQAFEPDAKVGLLGTLDDEGCPHVTLITTLMARGPQELMWGQFCEGRSKRHVRARPRTAYLVLTAAREVFRGHARWRDAVSEGEDHARYNRRPIYRYNAYFGIHTVHHMDLVAKLPGYRLGLPSLVAGGLAARTGGLVGACGARLTGGKAEAPLGAWPRAHIDKLDTLKFLAYEGAAGYPTLVGGIPCATAGPRALVFAPSVCSGELLGLSVGQPLALFALSLKMESILVQGTFRGYRRQAGLGLIEIERVYNPMPPLPGPVFPPDPLA